jgi:hypothetical protein
MTPAMKSLPTEMPDMLPTRIMVMLGGMIRPSAPPADYRPDGDDFVVPAFFHLRIGQHAQGDGGGSGQAGHGPDEGGNQV